MLIPAMPDGLTAQWLTEQLRAGGYLTTGQVAAVDSLPLGEGSGMMSEVRRLRLSYRGDQGAAPDSLVAKYPSQNPTNRESARAYRVYEREVRYFLELDAQTAAYAPATFLVRSDGDNFVILMEDLGDYRVGDQVAGADRTQTEHMIDALAQLHGGFWGRAEQIDWVPGIADSYHAEAMQALCPVGWANMRETFAEQLHPSLADAGERFAAALPALQQQMQRAPTTLLHGDFRMENVLFGVRPEHRTVAIIDWQGPLKGCGLVDVALMLAQSARTAVRRSHEAALLERYHRGLTAAGVRNYPREQVETDYRAAVLYNWAYVAVVSGTLDSSDARARAWMSKMVARQSAASMDLDVLKLLP